MDSYQAEGDKEFRYGAGGAEVFDFALLDEEGYPVNKVHADYKIIIIIKIQKIFIEEFI